ncbi:hypothetical protein [Advenella mimigardefordensis]|uniref:Uncharacterized protein n=1 Tax=Advenella mimigardefordensis (strain DSM 17166 / LMG 22922 / DPN7) TaxID=1247726 RepID=W0PJV0_ADVMD|nr:hypothetical protein [Advenella mimigardefordensis]AHG65258.1 hypothetical protein MIM_c31940 [Advenella mimigardefordensis DPN7]
MNRIKNAKFRPFVELPLEDRQAEATRLQQQIDQYIYEYGGGFTSRAMLNEPGRPEIYDQSFSFYFLGKDKLTIWNAIIITARKAFWDEVNDLARNRATDMLTDEELEEVFNVEFVPVQWSPTGEVLGYSRAEKEERRFEKFGGLTYHEMCRKLETDIIHNEPPPIYESYSHDRSYVYGIGLYIVVDKEVINQPAIDAAIERFLELGEREWGFNPSCSKESIAV